jgi:hypothetical protein
MPISWITESRTAADLAQTDVSLEVGGIERHKVAQRRTAEASDGSLAFVTNFIVSLGLSEAQGARPIGRTTVRNNFGALFRPTPSLRSHLLVPQFGETIWAGGVKRMRHA